MDGIYVRREKKNRKIVTKISRGRLVWFLLRKKIERERERKDRFARGNFIAEILSGLGGYGSEFDWKARERTALIGSLLNININSYFRVKRV